MDLLGLSGGVTSITGGMGHTCVLQYGGVKCWGIISHGQLGDSTKISKYSPGGSVTGLNSDVHTVVAGNWHACAITTTGLAKCWGNNGSGQLGDGTIDTRLTPVDVVDLTSESSFIAAGSNHTCAIHNGKAKCWGVNDNGK